MQSVVTEASVTPSTTKVTLGAGQNAVRVFFEQFSAAETSFFLYAKRNSDAVQKIKIYPWTARVLASAEGDTWAFGTSDGRTISMAAMAHPVALESSFPVTGTANADTAVPLSDYWVPAAAHVTLAAAGSAFQLADTSTSELVFIREFDGVAWTPARWVRKQSGRATTVRCTYQQIALGTRNGASLSIAAPTGAVIGGTSTDMVNPYLPAVTGASRNVSDATGFLAAIALAVAGDEIVLAAGTYALSAAITHTSFVANHNVGGRIGMEGILIRGATGNKADVIVTGNGVLTNGNWNVRGGTTLFQGFKDLTFALTGLGIITAIDAGKWAFEDVRIHGEAGAGLDCFNFSNSVAALRLEALRMVGDDASSDVMNGFGDPTWNATSRTRFVNCSSSDAGATSSDQCLTSHTGLSVEWYGGLLSDANTNVVAPDSITSPMYLFFANITKGARNSGILDTMAFGCDIVPILTSSAGMQAGAHFNHIDFSGAADANAVFRSITNPIEHNFVYASADAGRGVFNSNAAGTAEARYNIFRDIKEPMLFTSSAGAGGNANSYGNSMISCPAALRFTDANLIIGMKNNATKVSTIGIDCTAASMAHITTNFNTIDPTIDADFIPGASDLVAGDAALDAFFFPTAAGNCDGNGDTTLEDYIGDSDPWGYVRVYKASRVSRGARDIPAMHSAAYLHPDLF